MKSKFQKRQGSYNATLAINVLDSNLSIHSLSIELEPQLKFENNRPTDEIIAYKAWFTQKGMPPFEVKSAYLLIYQSSSLTVLKLEKSVITSISKLKTLRKSTKFNGVTTPPLNQ